MNVQPRTLLTANDIRAAGFRPEAGSETVDEQVAHVWYPSSRRGDRWDIGLGLLGAQYVEDADRYWDGLMAELGGGDVAPERVAVGDQAVHADGWLYARYRGQVFWIAVEGPDPVLARWAVERLARTVCPRLTPLTTAPPQPPASPPTPAGPDADAGHDADAEPGASEVSGSGPAAPVSSPPAPAPAAADADADADADAEPAGSRSAGPPSSPPAPADADADAEPAGSGSAGALSSPPAPAGPEADAGSDADAEPAGSGSAAPVSSLPASAGPEPAGPSSLGAGGGVDRAEAAGPSSSGAGGGVDRAAAASSSSSGSSAGPSSSGSRGAADLAGPAAGRSSGSGGGAVPTGPVAAAGLSGSGGGVDLADSAAPPSSSTADADAAGGADRAESAASPRPSSAEEGGGGAEERGGAVVLRPKASAPGRYRRRHLARTSLAVDGGELVATDARGRERRWALDGGPDAPAAIGLTVDPRRTLGAPVAYLAVVDGAGRLLVRDGELGVWALDDVRRFAAAAGLRYLEPEARTHEVDWHRQPVELEGTPWGFILLSLAAVAAVVVLVATSAPAAAFPAAVAVIVAVGAAGSRAGQVRVRRAPDEGMSDG